VVSTRPGSLILTVTRACNLRCAYCPTAKDGWPSLTAADARTAIDLFVDRYGGGDIKLFGGEPLLVPDVVRAAMDHAAALPAIRRVYLSTNGLGLNREWLDYLRGYPKGILTISIDGRPADHRRLRRALPGVADTYDRLMVLRPQLLETPRLVVTQTIAPATARHAAENFRHLLSLGFRRFNLLPGYYIPWRAEQLQALRKGFAGIRAELEARWASDRYVYLRNLFTWAPTPFFNTGLVVDADRSIHPSNVGLSGALDHLREQTRAGTLDAPPYLAVLQAQASSVNDLLASALSEKVLASTQAVDAELTALCRSLYPSFAAYRRRRKGAA
jgi:hypothetical protein